MYRGLQVAVVVPAYHEEDKIAATLASIPPFVDHVLVIDDGGQDQTAERAVSALRGRAGAEVLRHPQNRGVGAAIATGYSRALHLRCDVACVMAGDGQMDPADLPALLDPIASASADYVKGNRFGSAAVWREMPPARLLGNVVLSLATRLTSGYWHIFDSQCGFTAASRRSLEAIDLPRLFPRYGYPNDLLARLHVAGLRVAEAPVRPIYGPAWRSGITLRTALYPVAFVLLRSLLYRLRVGLRRWLLRAAGLPRAAALPRAAGLPSVGET